MITFAVSYTRSAGSIMRLLIATIALFAMNLSGCGFNLSSLEENTNANSVFESTFATTAPPDVTNLQAYEEGVSSCNCYLRFNAPFSTVKKLTGNTFAGVNKTQRTHEWLKQNVSGVKPDWWQPLVRNQTQLFESATFHPSYADGNAILIYNPEQQETHLYWNGWD